MQPESPWRNHSKGGHHLRVMLSCLQRKILNGPFWVKLTSVFTGAKYVRKCEVVRCFGGSRAKRYAVIEHRSLPKQIEYWSRIGKIAEENPDLPFAMIRDILLADHEAPVGEYRFG